MNIWQELRRRRVYRLAGLYMVGAWLVIQVADILFPAWGVPDTALRYLFIASAACFPLALVFSWFYDITSKGIVRTKAAGVFETADLKLKGTDFAILATLLAVGLVILMGSAEKIQKEIETASEAVADIVPRDNSVAVLPFTNLDTNADTRFFSDGITEEILHRLSTLGALHVLASTSSFAFRDSDESLSEIGKKLGVRYLLQGSIRRDNDYVRVTARLIDASGFQVWSQSFDRKLESIFVVQTEIASTVASEIINEIIPVQELPAGRTTTNMEAYNEYLVGRRYFDTRVMGWREKAIAAYQNAIDLDPGFAPPYAGLATAKTINSGFGPHLDEAMLLAKKALELDPELAEAHAIFGLLLSFGGNHAQGASSLRRAIQLDPSFAIAYAWLNFPLEAQGLQAEADAAEDLGLEIDPLNPPLVANVAARESRNGNFDRAEQLLMRLINLPQPAPLAFPALYHLYDNWGRFADAAAFAKRSTRHFASSDITEPIVWLAWSYANLGMAEDADYWTGLVREIEQDDLETLDLTYNVLRTRDADSELGAELRQLVEQTEFHPGEDNPWTLAQFGLVNIQLGIFETGSEQLQLGLRLFQVGPGNTEPADSVDIAAFRGTDPADVVYLMHLLAFAYQQIDRNDEADSILQALADEFDLEHNALHFALTGDSAGALQAMRSTMEGRAATYYGRGKFFEIVNEPAWAETIKSPEFQALLGEVKKDVERQHELVEAVDAEHDFRAEAATLLETRKKP